MNIDIIIQMAKDHILKTGHHLPQLFVELDTQEMRILSCPDIVNSAENREKQHRFFTAGRILSEDNPGKDIAHIAFAVEAWVSATNKDQPRFFGRPSLDPSRKECLIVNTLNIVKKGDGKYVEQDCNFIELIRDESGKLIDLLPWKLEEGKAHSTLLTSFLAGFVSTQVSKEQKEGLVAKMMGPDATGEEVRGMSKEIFERKMRMVTIVSSDIPSKQGKTSYRKTKKRKK
jgi:hypothetical protein